MANHEFKQFENRVRELLPSARFEVSAPAAEDGYWMLDVMKSGAAVVVKWRQGEPFGLATPDKNNYGCGADEEYDSLENAAARIHELIVNKGKTINPREVTLRQLRAERNISQVQLAELLGVSQPAVSRAEDRVARMQLDTLKAIAKAMNAKLIVQFQFEDGGIKKLSLEEEVVKG